MNDHHRGSDDVINEVKRLIEEETLRTREWQDKHDTEAASFRTDILNRIKPFEDFAVSVSWGWKILLALSGLVLAIAKAFVWVKDHVR